MIKLRFIKVIYNKKNYPSLFEVKKRFFTFSRILYDFSKQNDLKQFNLINTIREKKNVEFPMLIDKNLKSKTFLQKDVLYKLPSVSTIINETMSEIAIKRLEIWKNKMIKKLGTTGFDEYQKNIFSRGRKLHKNLEFRLTGKEKSIEVEPEFEGCWNSLQKVFSKFTQVKLIEERINHPALYYKGIVDCVAHVDGVLHVIDWKTSEKQKETIGKLYDAPLQTMAYLGAINYNNLVNCQIKKAAVVVAYEDGSPADYHNFEEIDCIFFWKKWVEKVQEYWLKKIESNDYELLAIIDKIESSNYYKNNNTNNKKKTLQEKPESIYILQSQIEYKKNLRKNHISNVKLKTKQELQACLENLNKNEKNNSSAKAISKENPTDSIKKINYIETKMKSLQQENFRLKNEIENLKKIAKKNQKELEEINDET